MKGKKIYIHILLNIALTCSIYAQRDYATGIGVRSWPYWGITFKQFVTDQTGFEIMATSRWDGLILDGLYEFHHNTFNTSNFNLFYGFGGHLGWWSPDIVVHPWLEQGQHISVGINLIGGIEYSFDEIPFSVSVDWKPLFVVVQNPGIDIESISFSVRYNIK